MKNNSSYGLITKTFHWLMAIIFFGIFPLGYIMTSLADSDFKFSLFAIHKSIGLILFTLVVLRLNWRLITPQPSLPKSVPAWQRNFAKFNIALLYTLMFAMPITGFMSSILGGYGIKFFSLFTIQPIMHDELIAGFLETMHGQFAYLLIASFSLHLLGALYHHFFLRDGVMNRMLPFSKLAVVQAKPEHKVMSEDSVVLIGFYAENADFFEFSNFGGRGSYVNRFGDRGEYSEITYQASKLWYLADDHISRQLRRLYGVDVTMPQQAFDFVRRPQILLDGKSINEMIIHNHWEFMDDSSVANKEKEMAYCLINKFTTATLLAEKLISVVSDVNAILVEQSPTDFYWGYAVDQHGYPGKNRLGLLLTALGRVLKQTDNVLFDIVIDEYCELVKQFHCFDFSRMGESSPV